MSLQALASRRSSTEGAGETLNVLRKLGYDLMEQVIGDVLIIPANVSNKGFVIGLGTQ